MPQFKVGWHRERMTPLLAGAPEKYSFLFKVNGVRLATVYMDHDGQWIGVSPLRSPRVKHHATLDEAQAKVEEDVKRAIKKLAKMWEGEDAKV